MDKSVTSLSRSSWPSAATQQAFFKQLLQQPFEEPQHLSQSDVSVFFRSLVRGSASQSTSLHPAPSLKDTAQAAPALKVVTGGDATIEQVAQEPSSELGTQADAAAGRSSKTEASPQAGLSWSERLSQGLSKTRGRLLSQLNGLLSTGVKVDEALFEDIECELLAADVGIEATERILVRLRDQAKASKAVDAKALYDVLQIEMQRILSVGHDNALLTDLPHKPFVLLVVGVNGVGKTTTIGKIANHQKGLGRQVMLAAGDTFRAAAIDQLKTWGERLSVPVIAQQPGSDSASVVFDALNAAKARGADILIADTAGRLHTKDHLMDELRKVQRVLKKIDPEAPHAVLLVLDAGNGQNALNQARVFHEAVNVSGIALTKLDGTARGGISFAICETLGLPLWFIGVGEQADDLQPFNASDFVRELLKR